MKIKLFKVVYAMAFFMLCSFTQAQTVSGIVSDASGPLPGASVIIQGTDTGVTTDFDGNYTLDNVASDAVLVISFIGYVSQEVAVAGQTVINVTLAEDASELDEVVVVGYTTQTRGDITGSVVSVDMAEAVKVPVSNAAESLQGRVTGVNVVTNSAPGAAPKVVIRGLGTTNNTDPLYIIDGVQTDDPEIFNSINPTDIEQMNVLKDGAASIYGARASNGVVIITTKGGGYNMDKAVISFDMYTGFSQATNLPSLLNAEQHKDMIFQSLTNKGAEIKHPQYDPSGSGTFTVPSTIQGVPNAGVVATVEPNGTYWPDAITRNAPTSNISFSLQNGSATGKYFMSANYLTKDGVLNQTFFKRGSTRLNSEFKIGEKFRIGEHLNLSITNFNDGVDEAFENTFRTNPLIPVLDDAGNFAGTYANTIGTGNARSPYAQLERAKDNFNKSLRAFGDIYAALDITDELTIKTTLGASVNHFNGRSFLALDPEHGESISVNKLDVDNAVDYSWTWTNTLTYNNTFGEHNINLLLGTEALQNSGFVNEVSRTDYLFEDPDFYNLASGSGATNVDFAEVYENSLFSIFGSANYSYAAKYFVTATLRRDETSRFLSGNKSDIFPSFSAGWLMSKEDFFPADGFVSRLKLKGSWGELGNQTLPTSTPSQNINVLSDEFANYPIDGNGIAIGAFRRDAGNPNLRWEKSVTSNLGLELGLFENKLNVELEVFKITTDGLISLNNNLYPTTAPDTEPPYANLGSMENTGMDLGIGFADETSSGWSYGVNVNVTSYKNEVTKLGGAFLDGDNVFRIGAMTRSEVGRPVSSFYGRVIDGFNDEGRFVYKDVNNDGVVNDKDRTFIGSPHPDFTYGINLNLGYEGFDFSAFLTGSQGNDIYNYNKIYTDFPVFFDGNRSTRVLDSWTPTNTNASLPALSTAVEGSEINPNTYFVEDGSFLRLKNIQLGYSLPESLMTKLKMDNVRIYVQATNLFTITGYDGIDPELIPRDNLTLGVDWRVFPLSKLYSLGINIKL